MYKVAVGLHRTNRLMQFSCKLPNSYPQRLHSILRKHSSYFGGSSALKFDKTYMEQEVIFRKPFIGRANLLLVTFSIEVSKKSLPYRRSMLTIPRSFIHVLNEETLREVSIEYCSHAKLSL